MEGGILIWEIGKVRRGSEAVQACWEASQHKNDLFLYLPPQPRAPPRGLEGTSSFCPLKTVSSAEVGTAKSLKGDLVSFSSCNEAKEFLKRLNFGVRP